jgi:hypothetical protein
LWGILGIISTCKTLVQKCLGFQDQVIWKWWYIMLHTLFGKEGIKGKWGQEDKYEQLSVGKLCHNYSSISSSLIIDIFTIWTTTIAYPINLWFYTKYKTRTWRNQSKVIYWVHFYVHHTERQSQFILQGSSFS